MSENLKPRPDPSTGETQQERLSRLVDPNAEHAPDDDAESQMRKALGLLGDGQRPRPDSERSEQPSRNGDRFNGGLHRRRFVQDGDIPVTVLRRDQGHEVPAHRGVAPVSAPSSSRLQRTEAALAAETAAREKAERALAETLALTRDLQTKIGHAELAKNEAIEALRREREAGGQLRADFAQQRERLDELLAQVLTMGRSIEAYQSQIADERQARKAAEKSLHSAEMAREAAEERARALALKNARPQQTEVTRPEPTRPEQVRLPLIEPEAVARAKRSRAPIAQLPGQTTEPEPVKWWLNTKPKGKRK